MNDSVIGIGAGGNARVIIETIRAAGIYNVHGLLDIDRQIWGTHVLGVEVLGDDSLLPGLADNGIRSFFIGLGTAGSLQSRKRLFELALACGFRPIDAIHPSAIISPSARIGKGLTVMANAVVNAEAELGDNVLVNTGAIIEHGCIVGNHVHLSPRATLLADVRIGSETMIGAGAVIRQGLQVGANVMVGAGAVAVTDIPDGATVVGIPAKPLHQ